MPYCGEQSLVKYFPGKRTARKLTCRSWSCPDCQPDRQRRLKAEAGGGAPDTFLTLTSRKRDNQTPYEAALALSDAWRRLRRHLIKKYKLKDIPFIAVFEATKLGWPHLHILMRARFIPQAEISEFMAAAIDSPIVYIERIKNRAKVGAYVAKYCGKAPHKFGTAKRYWKSKRYELRTYKSDAEKREQPTGYEIDPWNVHRLARSWTELGWQVTWLDSHTVEVRGPP